MIACGRFDRNDLVGVCAHRRCQVLEHEVPTVYKPLGVNASVKVEFLEFLDEVEDITLSKVTPEGHHVRVFLSRQ